MAENYFYSTHSAQEMEDVFDGAVLSNKGQTLSTSQKAQARANIGAGSENTGFQILGYYLTLEDLKESLQVPPQAGDAYGIAVFRLTTDTAPEAGIKYYTRSGSGTTEDPYTYTLFTGGSFEPGVDYYVIAYYDTYVYDGASQDWLDIGPINEGEFIDDSEISPILTWSSQKINAELAARDTEIGNVQTAADNAQDAADNAQSTADSAVSYADAQTLTTAQQKQARDNIGAAQAWALLWSNPSPSASFSAQTVALDLSGYSRVRIAFEANDWDGFDSVELFIVDFVVGHASRALIFDPSSTQFVFYIRTATPTTTGVVFSNATWWTVKSSGLSNGTDNQRIVPVYIYAQ